MSIRTEILWALGLGAGLLLVMMYMEPAAADRYYDDPPVVTTEVTNITNITTGIENNEFHSSIAATMAADAIHCTTSSRKHQMGVGVGYDDGHSGFAAGYCHSIEIKGQPVMIGVKATSATDTKPKYSVGLNWTF